VRLRVPTYYLLLTYYPSPLPESISCQHLRPSCPFASLARVGSTWQTLVCSHGRVWINNFAYLNKLFGQEKQTLVCWHGRVWIIPQRENLRSECRILTIQENLSVWGRTLACVCVSKSHGFVCLRKHVGVRVCFQESRMICVCVCYTHRAPMPMSARTQTHAHFNTHTHTHTHTHTATQCVCMWSFCACIETKVDA